MTSHTFLVLLALLAGAVVLSWGLEIEGAWLVVSVPVIMMLEIAIGIFLAAWVA